MWKLRARSAACRSFVTVVSIASAIGCATTVREIGPDDVLRANEGLLVLHVRTELPLRSIAVAGGMKIPLDVRPGTHLRVVAVSSGSHRWSELEVPIDTSVSRDPGKDPGTVRFRFADVADLRFRVEAGRINYPGMMEIYAGGYRVGTRTVDRTALAMEGLRADFPKLFAKYPLAYSGPGEHVFVERYSAVASARKKADVRETSESR